MTPTTALHNKTQRAEQKKIANPVKLPFMQMQIH